MLFGDGLFLGHDLLAWLVLAIGAAMVVGNIAAIARPPGVGADAPGRVPVSRGRSMTYIAIGSIAALWALATLLAHP